MTYQPLNAADLDTVCPLCGAPCNHTPQEMQGFAYDAAEEATKLLNEGSL